MNCGTAGCTKPHTLTELKVAIATGTATEAMVTHIGVVYQVQPDDVAREYYDLVSVWECTLPPDDDPMSDAF